MRTSSFYDLKLYEGTDVVNPLVVDVPNFEAIDEIMHDNATESVGLATELASGSVHAITRDNPDAAMFRFIATANWTAGDTMTIDGIQVTVLLPSGETLGSGAYVINSSVLGCLNGTLVTLFVTGGVATLAQDSEKLGGELPSYYGTASDVAGAVSVAQAANTIAQAAQTAVNVMDSRIDALEQPTYNIGVEELIGTYNNKPLYRKRYRASGIDVTGNLIIDSTINNTYVDDVIKIEGTFRDPINGFIQPINFASGSYYATPYISSSNFYIGMSNAHVGQYSIEIQYTKA